MNVVQFLARDKKIKEEELKAYRGRRRDSFSSAFRERDSRWSETRTNAFLSSQHPPNMNEELNEDLVFFIMYSVFFFSYVGQLYYDGFYGD